VDRVNLFGECDTPADDTTEDRKKEHRIVGKSTKKPASFEKKYERLERILDEIESEDIPLDKLTRLFEEGVGLIKECSTYLQDARLTIESHLEEHDGSYTIKGLERPEGDEG
jgi:exodeoxyribonuclease VII small subunit